MLTMPPTRVIRSLDGGAANFDSAGIIYVVTAILYTAVLAVELFLLYRQRAAFGVRIRGLDIVFTSVSMLHVYLVLVLLVYPLNGHWPCSAEFWVMSIFLPLGMAIFQGRTPRDYNIPYLTMYSLQCQSPHGLREPASNENRLFGWCAQEAFYLDTKGPLRSLAEP